MFNPLEMFQAQGEAGLQAMGQPFGLTTEQTARAFEALMPALTLGLQRSVGLDPAGFARMFGLEAAKPAPAQGFEALGQMFGSAQLMQAVLRQASATSGVGAQVLRQMLPMMAGAVVASIVHMLLNPPAVSEPAQPQQAAAAFPVNQAWIEMMKAFMPAAEGPRPQAPPSARPGSRGTRTEARPAGARSAGARPAGGPDTQTAGQDLLQQMLQTGAEVQQQNVRAMQGLFDAFWSEAGRAAGQPPAAKPAGRTPPKPGEA